MTRSPPPEDLGNPTKYDPDFNGPLKHRSCTDILCFILFFCFVGVWIGIGIYAFSTGNIDNLLVPTDSDGSRCGVDEHVKNLPYLLFYDPSKCLNPTLGGCKTPQICVKKCPEENFNWNNDVKDVKKLLCKWNTPLPSSVSEGTAKVLSKDCAEFYFKSKSFKKRCIPILSDLPSEANDKKNNILNGIKNLKILAQAEEVGLDIVGDIKSAWWKILIGVGVGAVISCIYILLLRWLAAILTWISLIGVVALLSAAVYFTSAKYIEFKDKKDEDSENGILTKKQLWLTLLIVVSFILLIVLLMLIFLRKRILLAIALVKEGSKAISSVTSVLIFPIFPWVLQIGVIAFAICVGLLLSTTGQPIYKVEEMPGCFLNVQGYTNGSLCTPGKEFEDAKIAAGCLESKCVFKFVKTPMLYPYLQVINGFGFLWCAFFISAMGQMILASIFATWYWTWKKSKVPFFAVTDAAVTVLRYHMGTLAFGSLIITICRAIRIVLEYIDQKLKKYDNPVTKAILCCCKCFFWCLEKFLKFINRNAYIMCAIYGKNFCSSAKDAFLLLMRNIVRVFVLDKVTDFLFFLGKLLITFGVGALAYLMFVTDLTGLDNSELTYNFVPVVIIMVCTYIISSIFFNVYSMAVDTLFLCFLEDCERNDGSSEKPYYMSKNLMNIFGKKNKQH